MEKKMLNVAWLNGATPIGKGGGASSGGSSGGSGSNGGEASTIEYLEVSGYREPNLINHSILARIELDGVEGIIATANFQDRENLYTEITKMIAVDFTLRLKNPMFDITVKEFLIEICGIDEEWLNSLPRVTKEEFYNLDNIETSE